MRNRARNLWTLGGLSLPDLLRRTARESWQDAVFGQGGRMAFYQFLAIFPCLLVFLAVTARAPYLRDHVHAALEGLSRQVLPNQASVLFENMLNELSAHSLAGFQFVSVCAGTIWAVANSTWAMIYGLNRAYEVPERRPLWQLAITNAALTLCMLGTAAITLLLVLTGAELHAKLHGGIIVFRALEWSVLLAALSLWFAALYRFAPNLRDCEWRWSTPGALCAVLLWIGATIGARIYFDQVNDYSRTYGHLNGVVILLLWLYVTNGAILIGGEMNSEIEKNAAEHDRVPVSSTRFG